MQLLAVIQYAAVALLFVGVIYDLIYYRLPNWLTLALGASFFLWAGLAGDINWWSHIGAGTLLFAIGLIGFIPRWFGGGDVKFMAGVGLWIGLEKMLPFLIFMALLGGVLALTLVVTRLVVAHRRAKHLEEPGLRPLPRLLRKNEGVPYGIAIGLAGLLVMLPGLPV